MNNWIEISEPNLLHNFRVLQQATGPATEILAVIKANAYGHGAETCAAMLSRGGVRWLGVTCASEGARVRAATSNPALRILVMCGPLPEDAALIARHALTPVVWTQEQLSWLAPHPGLRIHVEIDTGMGRQGVEPGAPLAALLESIVRQGLVLEGFFTHFCSSEVAGSPLTSLQQHRFEHAVQQLRDFGLHPALLHAGNSSTLDNPLEPAGWLDRLAASAGARGMVRSGLALYGYCLPIAGAATPVLQPLLRPVLTWKARVLAVRGLAPGDTLGYGATFTAARPMRIALLPVGYADGLRRELSSPPAGNGQDPGGWVMLHGRPAPILGRISMNLTVVDVTALPSIQPGDEAILLGPGITAEDHARLARTIPYEILCGLHPCG